MMVFQSAKVSHKIIISSSIWGYSAEAFLELLSEPEMGIGQFLKMLESFFNDL
jgi:hypothetical protein